MSVPFVQKTLNYKVRMRKNLSGNKYVVMDTISDLILGDPKSKLTLTKELSYRYLEKFLDLDYGYIGQIVRELVQKGFIRILKVGKKVKNICHGSIMQLILKPDEIIRPKESESHTTTEKNKPAETLNISSKNNSESCTTVSKAEPTTVQDNIQEKDSEPDPTNQNKSYIYNHDKNDLKKAIKIGKNILKQRNFTNINEITDRILDRIKNLPEKIHNIGGYFVSCCKNEKPEAIKIQSAENTKKYIQKIEQGQPTGNKEYQEMVKIAVANIRKEKTLFEIEINPDEAKDYEAGLKALKVSEPEKVKATETELKRELKTKWLYTPNKAELIIKRFMEKYS